MKTTIIITLLIVAISAVVLAEESIEQAELYPVTGRTGLYCKQKYQSCRRDIDCCQNLECYGGSFCRSTRKDEQQ
uniref:Secretory peptide n=1 Tax=Heteropoda venatoria TaxID=152925 RepID=A0A088BPH2_HETVE|nr:secretory peptide [Heteropoda venatoria]